LDHLKSIKTLNSTIGFVPLWAHYIRALVIDARIMAENDYTVVSIFVNLQFNNPEDLSKYPRTLEADINKISGLSSEIILYANS
jgi:pantoate--beta-alanine ligase